MVNSSTILYYTILYTTLLYTTLLYSTLLYSTLLYSTLLTILKSLDDQLFIRKQDGSTALMYAAQAGNLDAVTFLISKGSNTEQQRKVREDHVIHLEEILDMHTSTWQRRASIHSNLP